MGLVKKPAYIALLIVCIVWGTTYFALRIGVKTFPPLLFSGFRQVVAGIILIFIAWFSNKNFDWSLRNLAKQSGIGFLLICMGNGLVGWAEVFIPSGLAALIASLIPLHIVILNLLFSKYKTINAVIFIGILFGLAGMLFIFKDNLKDLGNPGYLKGLLMSFTASICWAIGTILIKKYNSNNDTLYHNTALQFLFGGILMTLTGFIFEDAKLIHTVTYSAWVSLLYLALLGSIVAMLCYHYAIKNLPVSTVALYAYVNPFIAILMGCMFLSEKFTIYTALAFVLTIASIYLVNHGNNQIKKIT